MRILLINSVYREGSTGKIVAAIGDSLRAHGHEVLICYGIGDSNIDQYSIKICGKMEHAFNALLSRITGIPYGGIFLSNRRLKKIIKQFKPDVVHIHCINASMINVYDFFRYLASIEIKTVITLHAEIFYTAGCSHAFECDKWKNGCYHCGKYKQLVYSWFFDRSETSYKKIYNAINAFAIDKIIITAVSPWLANRARQSAVFRKYNIKYISNGIDTSVFTYHKPTGLIDKEFYKAIILFVTPYFSLDHTDIKGGRFIPDIANILPEYKFVIVSSSTSSKLGSLPSNVKLWGKSKNQKELAFLYSEADLTILLSHRETFSMVTAESLCCGTPVVGFRAGGPESIALPNATCFCEYGDLTSLKKAIKMMLDCNINNIFISQKAINTYSSDLSTEQYIQIYYTF